MKVVNYSINTFYVLKMAICLRSLKLFLKKWEFKHLGSFPGLVPFQGDYGYPASAFQKDPPREEDLFCYSHPQKWVPYAMYFAHILLMKFY